MLKMILLMNLFIHAEVNVKDASYFRSWTEKVLHRTYKSRSVHKSWLGVGWCTEFEKSLVINEQEIILSDCLLDQKLRFVRQNKVYISPTNPFDRIVLSESSYNREIGSDVFQKFDRQGRLIVFRTPQRHINIRYNIKGQIEEVDFGQNYKLSISKNGKQARLRGPGQVHFLYIIKSNLVEVRQNELSLHRYIYDAFDNMTRFSGSGKTESMKYNSEMDQIIEFISTDGCRNEYTYQSLSPLHSLSLRKRTCGKKVEEIKYNFHYRLKGSITVLARTTVEYPHKTLEQNFDLDTGLPRLSQIPEAP